MQTDNLISRDTLPLLIAFAIGLAIGLILSRGRVEIGSGNRVSANFVFGNFMIGSNNGRGNSADFGIEDSGDSD